MYFWNLFIQEVHKQYVRVRNYSSVIICFFVIMLPMPFEGFPCFILKTRYPRLNFRSSCLIYIYHTVWERLSPLSFLCQSCEFVISSIVSPPSLNEVTGKDSTRCYSSNSESDGGKRPPSRTDSNFLNMPPCEWNTLDVTGLPCLQANCVAVFENEQWPSCVPNFCLLVLWATFWKQMCL